MGRSGLLKILLLTLIGLLVIHRFGKFDSFNLSNKYFKSYTTYNIKFLLLRWPLVNMSFGTFPTIQILVLIVHYFAEKQCTIV